MQKSQTTEQKNVYPFNINVGNKEIFFRKWKVKDRKKYIHGLKNDVLVDVQDALVYDCLENKDLNLDFDEYEYVLTRIRIATFGKNIEVELNCDKCNSKFSYSIDIEKSHKPSFISNSVKTSELEFELDQIKDRKTFIDKYLDCLTLEEGMYLEFISRIRTINGNEVTDEEIEDIMDELDADEAEEIFSQYSKNKFKLDKINTIVCPNCGAEELYEFDDLPGFFPTSWFEE